MPLIPGKGDEASRLMVIPVQPLNHRPVGTGNLESIEPFPVFVLFHGSHIMPVGMRCEGEKVEVAAGDLVGTFERTSCIADTVVIV